MARSRASANYTITAEDKTQAALRNVQNNFKAVSKTIKTVTGVAAAASAATVGVFAAMYRAQAPVIDQLGKTSAKLGIATEKLQAMQDAGERAGVSTTQLNTGIQRMTRRLSEAATGTGTAAKALDELGISAQQIAKLSPDEQFKLIAERLADVESESDRVRLAFKFFDSEGVGLVNLTADAIREAELEMQALGISLTKLDVAKVEAANDQLQKVGRMSQGVTQQFTVGMAPAITAIAAEFNSAAKSAGGWKDVSEAAAGYVVAAVGNVGNYVQRVTLNFDILTTKLDQLSIRAREFVQSLPGGDGLVDDLILSVDKRINEAMIRDVASRTAEYAEKPFSEKLQESYQKALASIDLTSPSIVIPETGLGGSTNEDPQVKTTKSRSETMLAILRNHQDAEKYLEEQQAERKKAHSEKMLAILNAHNENEANIEQELADKKQAIEDRKLELKRAAISSLQSLSSLLFGNSKKDFEKQKKFDKATAVISGLTAVNQALHAPPGPPYTIPSAIATGLFATKQVKAIDATSWSGGGSISTSSSTSSLSGATTTADESALTETTTDTSQSNKVTFVFARELMDSELARNWISNNLIAMQEDDIITGDITIEPQAVSI